MSMALEQFLHDALDRVEHTTSIEAFFHRFEVIKSLVSSSQPWLPESYFASRFVYGLQEAFQLFVLRFHPTTIQAAYRLALIYEESIYLQYFPELVCQNVDLYEDNSVTEILLVSPIVERASEVIMSEYLSSESDTVVDSLGTNLKEDSAIAVDGFVITNQIQDTPETVELVAQQHKNLMFVNMVQQHSISTCEDVHHMGSRVGCVQSYVVRDCNADEESVGMSPDNDFLHTFKATGVNALDTSFAEIDITNVEWKIAIGSKGLKFNWDCRFPEGLSHQDPAEITTPASQPHNNVARCLCDSPELFAEGLNIGDSMGGSGVDGFHKTITPVTYKQSSCSNIDWFLSISVVGEVADFMMLPNSILEMAVEVDAVHTYVYALEVLSSANRISSKYPSSVQSLSFRAAEVVAISEEFSDEDKTTTGFHVIFSDPFTHTVRTICGLDNQLVEDNVYSDVVWVHKSECFALQQEWWLLLYPENFIQLNQSSIFLAFKGGTCQLPNLSYLDSCCRGSSGNLSPDSVWASAVRGVLLMPIFFIFSRCAMAATSHSVGHFLYAAMIFDSNEMLFSMFLILRLLLYDSSGCTQHPIVFIFGTMNQGPELCFLSSCLAWDSKEYMLSSVDASSVVARIWGDYAMLHKFKLKTLQINNVPELVFDIYFTLGTTAGTKVPTLHSKPRCIHASTLCMQTFLIQLMLLLRYMVVRKMVSTLTTVHKVLCGLMYPAPVSELKWVLTMGIVIYVLCLPENLLVTFVSLLLRRVHAVVNTILLHAHSIFKELQPYTIEEANAITGLDIPTITTIRSGGKESICFGYQRQRPHATIICLSFYMFVFHLSVYWFLHTLKNFHSIFIYSDCQLLLCVVDSSQEQLSVGEYSGGSAHSIRSKWCCGLGGSIISVGFTWSCQAFLTWTELDYFLLSFCWMTLRILPQSFVKVTHINHKTALNVDSDGATFGIFCLVIPMGMSGFGLCLGIFPAYWKLLVQIKIDVMRITQERTAAVNASIIARKTNHNMPKELVYSFRTISKKSFLHG